MDGNLSQRYSAMGSPFSQNGVMDDGGTDAQDKIAGWLDGHNPSLAYVVPRYQPNGPVIYDVFMPPFDDSFRAKKLAQCSRPDIAEFVAEAIRRCASTK